MARSYSAKQRKQKVTIEGDKELILRLKEMEAQAELVLKSAVSKGGKIALVDAKENAPVDTGALKESLKQTDKKSSPTRAEVTIDYDSSIKYGAFVELGANGRQANPFMRNAVDDNIAKINDTIANEISLAVSKKF